MSTIDSTGLMKIISSLATWMDLTDTKVSPVAQMTQYFILAVHKILIYKYIYIVFYILSPNTFLHLILHYYIPL